MVTKHKHMTTCEISGSHEGEYEDDSTTITLMMDTVCTSETSVYFIEIKQSYIAVFKHIATYFPDQLLSVEQACTTRGPRPLERFSLAQGRLAPPCPGPEKLSFKINLSIIKFYFLK
jgi:hypothetical protein